MRRLRSEDGAATVVIAVMLVALIGMVAFALDAAALYQEKSELQNGADAAALAIAEDCGLEAAPCTTPAGHATAGVYADANANDAAAGVASVSLQTGLQQVTVRTSTVDGTSGATILAPFFAQVLGYEGTTVEAEATAAWGHPRSLGTLPLIFSDCEWEKYGEPAGPLQPGPEYTGPPTILYFHGDAEPCHSSPSGQDMPGGFGWLAATGACEAEPTVGEWVGIDPGASPTTSCDSSHLFALLDTVILLPFFDDIAGTGNGATYHVAGFGAFHLTGFNFGGQFKGPSTSTAPCKGEDRCIAGYFTTATVGTGEFGGEDRGVILVKLIG